MKSNVVMFWILTAYFVLLTAVYFFWNLIATNRIEWVGTVALLLSGALSGMIAFYLMLVQRKQGGVLVEDRLDSDIDDGDPEIGEFAPWSWWPVSLAGSLTLIGVGFATGNLESWFWLALFALPLVAVAIVGWTYEHYRGNFAR